MNEVKWSNNGLDFILSILLGINVFVLPAFSPGGYWNAYLHYMLSLLVGYASGRIVAAVLDLGGSGVMAFASMACFLILLLYNMATTIFGIAPMQLVSDYTTVTKAIDGGGRIVTVYRDDRKDGVEIEYDAQENKIRETQYRNNAKNGDEVLFWKNGARRIVTHYVNNKEDGIEVSYRENGVKLKETPYHHGIVNGTVVVYDDTGNKKRATPYVNGEIHGIEVEFDEHGDVYCEVPYENGRRVGLPVWKDGLKPR